VIQLRRAVDADRAAIARLHEASIRQIARSHYTADEIDSWANGIHPDRYSLDEDFFVAEVDGVIVAFGQRKGEEIRAVYVHPDHTGRGLGRRLMDQLERNARAEGAERLFLNSSLNGEAFYETCGFRRVGEATHPTRGGIAIRCTMMEKSLVQST